ncbi:hypothetical protein KA005_34980 [bacterium]|nr:hypothetical protein [bacterium]
MENALSGIIVSLVTLGLGWIVGQRLTVYWAIRQKRRELEISALKEFYRLYGEFFSIWKQWAYCCNSRDDQIDFPRTTRWSLMERACAAEGAMEGIFVTLSCEKQLSGFDIKTLGKFRQAYQSLRESIRDNRDIGWWHQNQPEYLSFKRLAYLTASIIVSDKSKGGIGDALEKITSNEWENNWVLSNKDWKQLITHYGGYGFKD